MHASAARPSPTSATSSRSGRSRTARAIPSRNSGWSSATSTVTRRSLIDCFYHHPGGESTAAAVRRSTGSTSAADRASIARSRRGRGSRMLDRQADTDPRSSRPMPTTSEMLTIDREPGAVRVRRPRTVRRADTAAGHRRRRPPALPPGDRPRARELGDLRGHRSGVGRRHGARAHPPPRARRRAPRRAHARHGRHRRRRRARALRPAVPVVLLSAFDDEQLVAAGLEAGAAAYVDKTADRDVICRDVAEAAAAHETRSPSAVHGSADLGRGRPPGWTPRLTSRRARAAAAGPRGVGQARAGVPDRSRRAHPPPPARQHHGQARSRRPRRGGPHRARTPTSSADVRGRT